MHYTLRTSYSVRTTEELTEKLKNGCEKAQLVKGNDYDGPASVVWAFTGQGSFYPGMGHQLFRTCARFRESILSYQRICDLQGHSHIIELISDPDETRYKDKTIVQMQLAIVFLELALADLWVSWGVKPNLLIGHSLGEYSALCVSGVLSVTDTLYLVGKRSLILQKQCTPGTHAMLVVDKSLEDLDCTIRADGFSSCEVSCKNAPSQTVASGTVKDLKRLESRLKSIRAKTKWLQLPYGYHSAQVEPILDEFEACARGIHFASPKIPVASTLTATVVSSIGHFTSAYLTRQARERVDFLGALQTCKTMGLVDDRTTWIEFGPDPTCLGMIRSTLRVSPTRLLATIKSTEQNWKTTSTSLAFAYVAKIPIDWQAYHQEHMESLTLLELPTYAFDLNDFWSPYKQDLMGPGNLGTGSNSTATSQIPLAPLKTCLQYIVKESFQGDAPSATFKSYLSEPSLYQIIQDHLINGVALCPASVFCDMAYSAAEFVHTRANPGKISSPDMSIHALEITHPVVIHSHDSHQAIEIKAAKADEDWSMDISFGAGDPSHISYGSCRVRFGARKAWKKECSRSLYLIKKRLEAVIKTSLSGNGYRIPKPVVYKLFSEIVRYGETYQGLDEVFLDAEYREAVGRIRLRPNKISGHFTQNPYWLDNIIHLAGFILNGDVTKPSDMAFIATGFEVLYLIDELSVDEQYTSYVYIQDAEKRDILLGDVHVFNGETVVAHCIGVCFQRMSKKTLAAVLDVKSPGVSQTPRHHGHSSFTGSGESPKTIRNVTPHSGSTEAIPTSTRSNGAIPSKSSSPGSADNGGNGPNKNAVNLLLGIIASESGFNMEDLEPSTRFADMGIDSIMSITIVSAAKNQLDLSLAASFFVDFPTVRDLQEEYGASKDTSDVPISSHTSALRLPSEESSFDTPASCPDDTASHADEVHDSSSDTTSLDGPSNLELKPAVYTNIKPLGRIVLLQGRASSTETSVYLATDGAGSATAYIYIPALPNGRRIFALESPFLQNPMDFRCGIEEYCSLYVRTIQESQPHGPYIIGGWSAGAVYAYEICRQLLQKGEQVKCLFMIDMRVPRPMPDALEPTEELIEQAGLVTGIKRSGQILSEISINLKQHLVSTVKALTAYEPQPMDPARRPGKSFMVWARKGIEDEKQAHFKGNVKKEASEIDVNVMEDASTGMKGWFFAKRTAFGPNGWDKLVGDIECHVMEADHFSMVKPPAVSSEARFYVLYIESWESIANDLLFLATRSRN